MDIYTQDLLLKASYRRSAKYYREFESLELSQFTFDQDKLESECGQGASGKWASPRMAMTTRCMSV